ncbi:MAG TPA: hypothetical protein VMS22_11860 [Candidatus Eisenbacteria bacterium]|nr:hypothetical protein [Candidatus Eisenbacteria bacterium]
MFTFGLLEFSSYAYLRLFRGYDGEHLMNYEFDPYKSIRLTPNFRDTRGIAHNAQGFRRSEDTPREKPPGTYRIFLMGGSTGYGLQSLSRFGVAKYPVIRNDETIDHYLEQALDGKVDGLRVEVINAAITSFYSHHHLIYLNQTILKYHPDLVIFLDGFNDYYNTDPGFDQWRDYAYQERAHSFLGDPTFSAWAYYTGWWLFRKSHFFHLAGRALNNASQMMTVLHRGPRPHMDVDTALANLRVNAENNFVKMVERNGLILQHEGVHAIFALQPEISFRQGKQFSPLEQEIYDEMKTYWAENYIEFKNRARPIVLDYLAKATAPSGATVVDLTDIYGRVEGDVYTDYCHLTPTGNRVLAEHLVPAVLSIIDGDRGHS